MPFANLKCIDAFVFQTNINQATRLAVWNITEPEEFFFKKSAFN